MSLSSTFVHVGRVRVPKQEPTPSEFKQRFEYVNHVLRPVDAFERVFGDDSYWNALARRCRDVGPVFGNGAFRRLSDYIDVPPTDEVEMAYVEIRGDDVRSSQEMMEMIRRYEARPAFYEELLGYNNHWVEALMINEHWMRLTVSLGSCTRFEESRGAAVLHQGSFITYPTLAHCNYDGPWTPKRFSSIRFLAVRL